MTEVNPAPGAKLEGDAPAASAATEAEPAAAQAAPAASAEVAPAATLPAPAESAEVAPAATVPAPTSTDAPASAPAAPAPETVVPAPADSAARVSAASGEIESAAPSVRLRAAAPSATDARTALALSGRYRRARTGLVRVLLLVTGLALLAWLSRGLALLVGFRQRGRLTLHGASLELRVERRLLGIPLGSSVRVIPRAAIEQVDLVGSSSIWGIVAGVAALAVATAVGVTLVTWGVWGREPSWIAKGLGVIGCGVLLDALAYLLVRRRAARDLADLRIRSRGSRWILAGLPRVKAERVLEELGTASR